MNAGGNALPPIVTLVVTPRYHQHTVWRNTWAQPATPKNKCKATIPAMEIEIATLRIR